MLKWTLTLVACLASMACASDDTDAARDDDSRDEAASRDDTAEDDAESSTEDAGTGDTEPDCFEEPTTHYEIINACTNSVRVTKEPELRGLNPDGTLPEP